MYPKVSVIIPNYNHYKFLQQRLDSVFSQTYQDFEVIILDDASTDSSLEILNNFKNHPKVSHFVVNKNNSGSPFEQWKKGILKAKGKFVWIAESDDFCETTFLDELLKIFITYPNLSLVFSNSVLQNKIAKTEQILLTDKKTGGYNNLQNSFLYDCYFNYSNFRIINASSCIFKKECVDYDLLDKLPNYRYAGDKLFWASILIKYPYFGYCEKPLNVHTFHENTTRSKNTISTNVIRNKELLTIYDFCGFATYKNYSLNWKREYGKRLLQSFIFNVLLLKKVNFKNLLKGLWIVKLDLETWKRIYRSLKAPLR